MPEVAWTDQYALAITYSELRTGKLPFAAKSTQMQVIMAHAKSNHDFSGVTEGELAVLKRGTAKIPEERFPTCLEMLAELDAAVRAAGLKTGIPLSQSEAEILEAAYAPPSCPEPKARHMHH